MKFLNLILLTFFLFFSCSDDDSVTGGTILPPIYQLTPLASSNFSSYSITLPAGGFYLLYTSNYQQALENNETGWWHDAVIYQAYSAAFNSGALPTSKLDYLTNIGFDAVWSTPVFQSPSEHGYNITNYYAVKSSYGGNTALENYVTAAHQRGVKVILDMVINHTGSGHPWFTDSVNSLNGKRDWYVWSNTQPAGWMRPWGTGNNTDVWISSTGGYYYAAFWDGMPDLNLANSDVRTEVKNIADFWIGKGVDGFRLDAARYAIETGPYPDQADTQETKDWWTNYQSHLVSSSSSFYTIGEFWTDTLADMDGYYSDGKGLNQGFSFQFYYALTGSLSAGTSTSLLSYFTELNNRTAPNYFFAPFMDNHDEPDSNNRFMDSIAGEGLKNYELAKVGAAILLTMPGTPYVYYGSEIGMNKGSDSGDAAKRTTMEWGTASSQLADDSSLLNTFKRLIAIRKQEPALRRGALVPLSCSDSGVAAWLRPGPDRSVIVIVNLSGADKTVNIDFSDSGMSSGTTHYLYTLPAGTALGTVTNSTPVYTANQTSMFVRGTFNSWGNSNPMTLVAEYTWQTTISGLSGGETYKYEVSGETTWGDNWGASGTAGVAAASGGDISNPLSGTVTFTFNDQTLAYSVSQ